MDLTNYNKIIESGLEAGLPTDEILANLGAAIDDSRSNSKIDNWLEEAKKPIVAYLHTPLAEYPTLSPNALAKFCVAASYKKGWKLSDMNQSVSLIEDYLTNIMRIIGATDEEAAKYLEEQLDKALTDMFSTLLTPPSKRKKTAEEKEQETKKREERNAGKKLESDKDIESTLAKWLRELD